MTIEQMIALIMTDVHAKRDLNEIYRSIGKHVPTMALDISQAQEEACIILKEVQKLYEKTKEEDFGED